MTTRQQDDIAYYRNRLAQEEARTAGATRLEARAAHRGLAALYRAMLGIHEEDQSSGHHHASRTIVDRLRRGKMAPHPASPEPTQTGSARMQRPIARPAATARPS